MIKRYKAAMSTAPEITKVVSNTLDSSTANTATYTIVISGPKSCIVGFKVTIFNVLGSFGEMDIDGSSYVLNDTFNYTTDAVTGLITLTQFLTVTNSPGNRIDTQVTIETVSKGVRSPTLYFWNNGIVV